MGTIADLSGRTFGRLVVVKQAPRKLDSKNKLLPPEWECLCSCGEKVVVTGKVLLSGHKKSCGCLLKEALPPAQRRARKIQLMEQERIWGPCPYPMFGCSRNKEGWCCDDCDEINCDRRCQNLPQKCKCKRLPGREND